MERKLGGTRLGHRRQFGAQERRAQEIVGQRKAPVGSGLE
jgi:hypothetical protein